MFSMESSVRQVEALYEKMTGVHERQFEEVAAQ
jgi:hypothetical protein